MDFPTERFAQVGATHDELDKLKAEFDKLVPEAQRGRLEHLASIAVGDLVELLEHRRLDAETAPEPVEPSTSPSPPAPSSSATASAGTSTVVKSASSE